MQYANKVVMSDISKIIMMAAVLVFALPGISYGGHFTLAFQRKLVLGRTTVKADAAAVVPRGCGFGMRTVIPCLISICIRRGMF